MESFPRKDGRCKCHDFTKLPEVAHLLDVFDENKEFDEEKIASALIELNRLLPKLKVDLVKGDLILMMGVDRYRNSGVYIFDGQEIIILDREFDDYGNLPKMFRVINNNVPITYWQDIKHNSIIWVDIVDIRQQCLNNLVITEQDVRTTFDLNNKTYTIILVKDDDDDFDDDRETMMEILRDIDILLLFYDDCVTDKNYQFDECTVFINPDYIY